MLTEIIRKGEREGQPDKVPKAIYKYSNMPKYQKMF